jgi:acyl-CoA thioesterase FadM
MGGLRELVLAPIGKELLKDLGSGDFGMVTNTSEIQVLHEAATLDEITGNIWITGQSDLPNSLIDLNFAFYKNQEEKKILLANCKLSTTWVRIEGRGVVKKSPIPEYFLRFLNDHIHLSANRKNNFVRNGFPIVEDIGAMIYQDSNCLRPECIVYENIYSTGLTHGNTVGNLYYSNYYIWQSRMIEEYFYNHVPEIMTGGGKHGEFITLYSNVNHLQEAMPFESIAVTMYISEYYKNGLKLYFEYHSVDGATKRKLAYGTNTVVFCNRKDEGDHPVVNALPENLVTGVMSKIHNSI